MDFLVKTIGGLRGVSTPFNIGEKISEDTSFSSSGSNAPSIWTMHHGTMKNNGAACTVFTFDGQSPANRNRLVLAKNMASKLKRLRIPGVLKILECVESESSIMLATEHVTPLSHHLGQDMSNEAKTWGLRTVFQTLRHIETEGSHVHGNINVESVFVTDGGEWVVGGLELATCLGGSNGQPEESFIFSYADLLPASAKYCPPEVARGGWDGSRKNPGSIDSWQAGVLVYEVFNGVLPNSAGGLSIPTQKGAIPTVSLYNLEKLLTAQSAQARPKITQVLEDPQLEGALKSPLTEISDQLQSLTITSDYHFSDFLDKISAIADKFPPAFIHYKLLPELIKCLELNKGGVKAINAIIHFGKNLEPKEFEKSISPILVKMYASPDRAMRMQLLTTMEDYIHLFSDKSARSIFDSWATGLSDSEPVIREETLKSVTHLITKLTNRQVNIDLLRLLAKTQADQIADLRANTTILLGRIAEKFDPSTRSGVLIAAFTKALRDPHIPSRLAALMSLNANITLFSPEESCAKLMGPLSGSLLDKDKSVRDQATVTLDAFLAKIKEKSNLLSENELSSSTSSLAPTDSAENRPAWAKMNFGIFNSSEDVSQQPPAGPVSVSTTPPVSSFESPRQSETYIEEDKHGVGQTKGMSMSHKAGFARNSLNFGMAAKTGNDVAANNNWGFTPQNTSTQTNNVPQINNNTSKKGDDEDDEDADWSW